MSASTPYDLSSLVLGNIVDTGVVDLLKQIDSLKMQTDAAQDKMNSLITMKRSLAMTLNELIDMGIDISAVKEKIEQLDTSISQSANDYLTTKLENEDEVNKLRTSLYSKTNNNAINVVDFTESRIISKPLASESIKIDVQYFTFGSNKQQDTLANIEKYIKDATSELGQKSTEVTSAVSGQINRQLQTHSLSGTLIITASCTHRNVSLIEPLIINTENIVDAWNTTFSSSGNKISVDKPETYEATDSDSENDVLTIISGATYGSAFVGMVHMLNSDTAVTNVSDTELNNMKAKMQLGGWLQNMEGGFGVDSNTMNEVKSMLSTQTVSSHVSIVAMGTTPSIAAGDVKLGLKSIMQNEADSSLALLTTLKQSDTADTETIATEASQAKTANRLLQLQQSKTSSVLKGLSEVDHGTNKVMGINSLMAAFDNYIATVNTRDSSLGVPTSYYFKKITRSKIAKLLQDKYQTDQIKVKQTSATSDKNDSTSS